MEYVKRSYSKGWMPDADEVNGPPDALLRADNLILDELGVLALRQGTDRINSSALSDTDIHSLFTVVRSGTRYRYAGAGNSVYRNNSSILSGMGGSNDVFFGSHMGQTLIARGSTKRKDDGTTVRNLGISMTGGPAAVQAALASNSKQLAAWNSGETASHTIDEDDGSGLAYADDHDGTASGAAVLKANATTLRGVINKTFGGDQNFNEFTGPIAGADADIFSTWVYIKNPAVNARITMLIDVNGGTFQEDYYYKAWEVGGTGSAGAGTVGGGAPDANDPGDTGGDPPLI